jgi:hypothetical protein
MGACSSPVARGETNNNDDEEDERKLSEIESLARLQARVALSSSWLALVVR